MKIWISMLLLETGGAAVALGTYSIQGNMQKRIKRPFFAICVSLVVWSFGQALAVGAQAESIGVLGLRLANLGWDITACLILAFLMRLSGNLPLRKKWWVWLLAYLPSVFHGIGFSLLPFWGLNAETMESADFGWIHILSPHDVWTWGYFLQPLAFQAVGLWLLIRWARRSTTKEAKKQAWILILSFAATAVLSVVSDGLPVITGMRVPRVSAAFMLIPIIAVAHLFRRYHFLQADEDPDERILTEKTRTHIYFLIGMILIGCVPLLSVFSYPASPYPVCVCLLIVTCCLIAVNIIRMDDRLRELIAAICLSFVVSLASLWSVQTGNLTAWVGVFSLMIASLLFDWLIVLSSVAVSTFLSQLLVWSYQPVSDIHVSTFVYGMRLIILAVTAVLSVYVHRIYVRRLKENANHVVKQTLIAEVSHAFISSDKDNIDKKLFTVLEKCGRFVRCDRAHLLLLDEDGKSFRYSREWLAEGVTSGIQAMEALFSEMEPMMRRQIEKDGIAVLRDAVLFPPVGKAQKVLSKQGVRSLVVIPLKSDGMNVGFLGFNAAAPLRKWNLEDPSFLQVIAGIIAGAILKVRAEKKVNFIAYHDQLTGLPNRLLFSDRLNQAIPLADRTEKMLAVVFIDLDSFKSVNDTMGHCAGDQLLMAVAHVLTGAVRGYDTVSRFGGDEFILLLNQLSSVSDLMRILAKLTDILRRPFLLNDQKLFITASVGAAIYPQDGTDGETLIRNADTAMYHAKEQGKNRFALCSQDMKDEVLEKMKLTNLLYRALEKEQLLLYYQPQVDTANHSIVGCEALIRWNLPGRGMMMPTEFIPLAERTGLIQPIGAWVLKTACRQNQEWHQLGFIKLRMTVNLSMHQLKNPKFVQQVRNTLDGADLPARYLELEISESMANGNIENIVEVLNALRALGVTISIDGFGAEYSSLSRLKQLPVDRIKMDMRFVQGIETNEKDRAISKVIITLAKNLDLKVTAVGVETEPQLDFLSRGMCDEVQGFYYCRPLPADQMETVLRQNAQG